MSRANGPLSVSPYFKTKNNIFPSFSSFRLQDTISRQQQQISDFHQVDKKDAGYETQSSSDCTSGDLVEARNAVVTEEQELAEAARHVHIEE